MGSLFDAFKPKVRTSFETAVVVIHSGYYVRTIKAKKILVIDCTLSSKEDMGLQLTKHAIESGSDITDHAHLEPRKVTIKGLIVEEPLTLVSSAIGTGTSGLGQLTGGTGGAILGGAFSKIGGSLLDSAGGDRVKEGLQTLRDAMTKRLLLTLTTKVDVYKNMLITGFSVADDINSGQDAFFDLTLEEVKIANSKNVQVNEYLIKDTSTPSNTKKAETGNTQSTDLNAEKAKLLEVGENETRARALLRFVSGD